MFGKIFDCCFTGSMMGAGADVFAVWSYALANVRSFDGNKVGQVELNPSLLAAVIGMTPERAEAAIEFLCRPDKYSRSPEHDGRRLIHQHAFTYEVVNHAKYNEIRSHEERREYMREYMRLKREKLNVNTCKQRLAMLANTDIDIDIDTDKDKDKDKSVGRAKKRRAPTPPADHDWLQQVKANPAFAGVDVEREVEKARLWLATNRPQRQCTRRYLLNWLNKCERPVNLPPAATAPDADQWWQTDAKGRPLFANGQLVPKPGRSRPDSEVPHD